MANLVNKRTREQRAEETGENTKEALLTCKAHVWSELGGYTAAYSHAWQLPSETDPI